MISEDRDSMALPNNFFNNSTYARKFRWALKSDHLPEYYLKSVSFDWKKKKIYGEVYEIWQSPGVVMAIDWIEKLENNNDEPLTFTTYDGCGSVLYEYTFEGLKLESHTSHFDYASSDCATRCFEISYEKYEYNVKMKEIKKLEIVENEIEKPEEIVIEETEINFLNSKVWLPGKVEFKRDSKKR